MKYLMWLLKAAIFFTLFAFALNNQQDVDGALLLRHASGARRWCWWCWPPSRWAGDRRAGHGAALVEAPRRGAPRAPGHGAPRPPSAAGHGAAPWTLT